MMYRKIVFETIQVTHLQDQVLREMIEKGEHLRTDKIVSIDVEYGGARTVPRIAIVDFNEEVLYYSDFCLRYEDWVETKLTQAKDAEATAAGLDSALDYKPLVLYSEKDNSKAVADQTSDEQALLMDEDDRSAAG